MMKRANYKDVKKVINLMKSKGLNVDDISDNGCDIILSIDVAIGVREDDQNITPVSSETANDIQLDLDNLYEWKVRGVRYVYIDNDITTINGRCCLVSVENLKDFRSWVIEAAGKAMK